MLKKLKINNIALIDKLEVLFDKGLNVLSGETGAGKSIIIDSLTFVLGGKFDKTLIKQGEIKAGVTALFTNINASTLAVCKSFDIDAENEELILQRSAGTDGKNEVKINGETVTVNMLKQVAETLIDIHGQNENQQILKTKNQLAILDSFIGEKANNLKQIINENYSDLLLIKKEIKEIGGTSVDRERMIDFLKYQIKEITDAKLKPDEDEALEVIKTRMLSSEKIADNLSNASRCFDGIDSVTTKLNSALSYLLNISSLDDTLANLADRLKSQKIELDDIIETISDYHKNLDFNQYEFDKIDARLDLIKSLKKKYGGSINEVLKSLTKAEDELQRLENSEQLLSKLESKLSVILNLLNINSAKLSELRKSFATKFEKEVKEELITLGMKNAKFTINFHETECGKNGRDEVEFMFSANSGQDAKPLGKIISGGEMSRFSLSIKNITSKNDELDSMVFDEIDTGISGKIAEIVAEKMVRVSIGKQVIAVTHLPQIVAMADVSLLIQKTESENSTTTNISILDEKQHISEVARLIGSNMSSAHASLHASDLVEFGKKFKKEITE